MLLEQLIADKQSLWQKTMHYRIRAMALCFIFAFTSPSFAIGWVSQNVSVSPEFSSPSEACAWYIATLPGFTFSHLSSRDKSTVLPAPQFFCFAIWERAPGNTWNVGNTSYNGKPENLESVDEDFYNNAPITDEMKNLIRRSLQRFYGDNVNQWTINSKMINVFQKWLAKVHDGCGCFKFIPQPVTSPLMSASALVLYFLKYGAQIVSAHEAEANYACMLAAASGMKTEFWLAGNLE